MAVQNAESKLVDERLFDTLIDRRGTDSAKWGAVEDDVLPMWVADMDFRSPEPVIRALHERVEHGAFGYAFDSKELREVICERMMRLYQWAVKPDEVVFTQGVVHGLNLASRVVGQPGDGILMTTPVYGPFLMLPGVNARFANMTQMSLTRSGRYLHYEVDFAALEAAITQQTKLFMLCNPHNPVGRVYRRDELERMADLCLKHDLMICSDEIHADLLLDGSRHIPIAALSPEVADKTITLMAPSKTFNLPGLYCAFAIIQNEAVRKQFSTAALGGGHVNLMGFTAALAAYKEGQPWLEALLRYLTANRDFLLDFVEQHMPDVDMTRPEGTYLAWLDYSKTGIEGAPADFCSKHARVAVNAGEWFGRGGEGFIRVNFGCPRSMLAEALERLRAALEQVKA